MCVIEHELGHVPVALGLSMGGENLVFSYKCVNIDAEVLHRPHGGRSAILPCWEPCTCFCSVPTMRA